MDVAWPSLSVSAGIGDLGLRIGTSVKEVSVDLCYPFMFVHVRDMDVQVMHPYFLMGILCFLCPGCGPVFIWFPVPGLWA